MSTTLQLRGYVPRTTILTGITAGGQRVTPQSQNNDTPGDFGRSLSARIRVRNTGANELRLFWVEDDFTNNTNYVALAAGEIFSEPVEMGDFWVKSPVGTDMELTVFHRRG